MFDTLPTVFEDFYSTFASASLTITGLWMYVAQARFSEWLGDREHFRLASAVSVQLSFPGIMCMFALIDPASATLWKMVFGVTSVLAVVLLVVLNRRTPTPWPRANEVGLWVAVVLFSCIALVALRPTLVEAMGLDVAARRTEFFLFCLLLVDGLVVAWIMLFREARESVAGD